MTTLPHGIATVAMDTREITGKTPIIQETTDGHMVTTDGPIVTNGGMADMNTGKIGGNTPATGAMTAGTIDMISATDIKPIHGTAQAGIIPSIVHAPRGQ